MNRFTLAAAGLCLGAPLAASATNGMLLEGYGPVAAAMGGASMAHDNGVAAATNNPATLGLMAQGNRLDLAVGLLGPHVSSSVGGMRADSSGTSYVMPAMGYAHRSGSLVWGVALFAQGGMGTEYGANSFLAQPTGKSTGGPLRSELGVGRLIFPLAFELQPGLTVGGSLDFVWSSLDLRMALPTALLAPAPNGLVTGMSGNLGGVLGGGALAQASWARIDFSDNSDFTGQAKATGWAGKLGVLWQASPTLAVGASLHTKTRLSDMKTGGTEAQLSAEGGFALPGRMVVQDFQMPMQLAAGVAWQAAPSTLLAADVKRIRWSGVMDSFRMRFESSVPGYDGSVSFALPQQWKDQDVLQLGVAHRLNPQWVLRAGVNLSSNPVPDSYVNPLFPAIVKRHYSLGAGTKLGQAGELNASLVIAPAATATEPNGIVISHRQVNAQLMYSHGF